MKNSAPRECIIYQKHIDTHGIVSVTIPVSGKYKILTWSTSWTEKDLVAGEILYHVIGLVSEHCPGYNEL